MIRTAVTTGTQSTAQRQAILDQLSQFNSARAGPANAEQLCISIGGPDGEVVGGLYGMMVFDWLIIELLFVPEELRGRGLGSQLLAEAEEEARVRSCVGAWLDTFSFQARGFYEKLGYGHVGTIPDHPRGEERYFLMKRWA